MFPVSADPRLSAGSAEFLVKPGLEAVHPDGLVCGGVDVLKSAAVPEGTGQVHPIVIRERVDHGGEVATGMFVLEP